MQVQVVSRSPESTTAIPAQYEQTWPGRIENLMLNCVVRIHLVCLRLETFRQRSETGPSETCFSETETKRKIGITSWALGKIRGKWPVVVELWSCCTNKILQDLCIFSDSCVHNFCNSLDMTVFKGEDWHQAGSRGMWGSKSRRKILSLGPSRVVRYVSSCWRRNGPSRLTLHFSHRFHHESGQERW